MDWAASKTHLITPILYAKYVLRFYTSHKSVHHARCHSVQIACKLVRRAALLALHVDKEILVSGQFIGL